MTTNIEAAAQAVEETPEDKLERYAAQQKPTPAEVRIADLMPDPQGTARSVHQQVTELQKRRERTPIDLNYDELEQEIDRLRKTKQDLLKALTTLADEVDYEGVPRTYNARAAIAKAEAQP